MHKSIAILGAWCGQFDYYFTSQTVGLLCVELCTTLYTADCKNPSNITYDTCLSNISYIIIEKTCIGCQSQVEF